MRRIILTAFVGVVAFGVFATGCLDRAPAPVCPVPIEIASTRVTAGEFDGVDMLVVVDNSGSMAEEQQILSTGFFTLVNSLTRPIASSWEYPAVDNMRVAIVSSDMGLQYGEDGLTDGVTAVNSCSNLQGDNGAFLPIPSDVTIINVESGVIACEDGGGQCPAEFPCTVDGTGTGVCTAPGGVTTVNCVAVTDPGGFAETTAAVPNDNLTTQVACLAQQGTDGCGVEQQLEASVRGLKNNQTEFLVKSHLLAVLVVSDEEDCSVKDKGLYGTDEWLSGPGELLNIACNYPAENEEFLFPPERYHNELVNLKQMATAVIFAAIVGVPQDGTCQGGGDQINDCLIHPDMQLRLGEFETADGNPFTHFVPACTRSVGNVEVTSARPGRRYVSVAQQFGQNGYVYSICNEDWGPAMEQIAEIIARQISATCYPKQLDWNLLGSDKRQEIGCLDCGEAKCDVVVELTRDIQDPAGVSCPDEFYIGLTDAQKSRYLARKEVQDVKEGGSVKAKRIFCPLPKIPAPRSCNDAETWVDGNYADAVGWYYCETDGENFLNACEDGNDNDGNGFVDCADSQCSDCPHCNGEGIDCPADQCSYGVELTQAGKDVTTGYFINVQCLQQFRFEDQNCQEDSPSACNNNKDDDGNGVWDCMSTLDDPTAKKPHAPDSNCCPMTKGADNRCEPKIQQIQKNCKANWLDVDACRERIRELGCTPP